MKNLPSVLITGATSGIGYELARLFAMEKYNMVIVARDESQLGKVAAKFKSMGAPSVLAIPKDLSVRGSADELYNDIQQQGITVNILINDAGQGEYGKFVDTDLERQIEIIQLNVISLVSLTHYFLKDMVRRNEGKILQLGSEVSKVPAPMMAVYGATKAFVLSFTEALVNELKDTKVSMTLLMPGATDTDFFDKANMEDTKTYRENKLESPESVAADAFEALMEGERRVVASNAKMNVAMAAVTPDNVNAKKMAKAMEPSEKDPKETRHQPEHIPSLEEKVRVGRKGKSL
jgi:short-subunit dehydrogenase